MSDTNHGGEDLVTPEEESALERGLRKAENMVLAIILLVMTFLGLLPVAFRATYFLISTLGLTKVAPQFLLQGVTWNGRLSNYLVIWLAMIGACAATQDRKHICVDAVGQLLNARRKLWVSMLTNFLALLVCAFLSLLSVRFVRDTAAEERHGLLSVPEWGLQLIMPVGFALLCLHLFLIMLRDFKRLQGTPPEADG